MRVAELREATAAGQKKAAEEGRKKELEEHKRALLRQEERSKEESLKAAQQMPRLRALLVGVQNYASPKLEKLSFTAKDARDLSNLLLAQETRAYRKVELKLLQDATRAQLLQGLQWLERDSEE